MTEKKTPNRPVLRVIVLEGFDAIQLESPPIIRREQIAGLVQQLQNAVVHMKLREARGPRK